MTTITLWNGRKIPRLGMGCWAIGGPFWAGDQALGWGEVDDQESIAAIRRAIDLGVRYFDTADIYGAGHSEEVLSQALSDVGDEIIVSTKFGNTFDPKTRQVTGSADSADCVRQAVEGSLQRLGRERLDLVLFHLNDHPVERSAAVFETLSQLRGEGKIDAFGWSTDDVASAAAFADMDGFECVQHDLNLFRPAAEMLALTAGRNLVSIARQPLAMGLLTGKFRPGGRGFAETDIRAGGPDWLTYFVDGRPNPELLQALETVRGLLTSGGRTVAQGALGWIWARSPRVIPIPGFRNSRQVEDNARALEKGPLAPEIVSEIDRVLAQLAADIE